MGLLIGISGCSASGKSTLARGLAEKLSDRKVNILCGDRCFRKPLPKMRSPLSGLEYDDYNSMETLNIGALLEEIDKELTSNELVIAEGVLLFCFPEFVEKSQLNIFVNAPIETRLSRRLVRNTREYGMDFDDVLRYYMEAARFSERRNTVISGVQADIVVNGERDFARPLDVLSCYVRSLINS